MKRFGAGGSVIEYRYGFAKSPFPEGTLLRRKYAEKAYILRNEQIHRKIQGRDKDLYHRSHDHCAQQDHQLSDELIILSPVPAEYLREYHRDAQVLQTA